MSEELAQALARRARTAGELKVLLARLEFVAAEWVGLFVEHILPPHVETPAPKGKVRWYWPLGRRS
jgi:hypothetical protein